MLAEHGLQQPFNVQDRLDVRAQQQLPDERSRQYVRLPQVPVVGRLPPPLDRVPDADLRDRGEERCKTQVDDGLLRAKLHKAGRRFGAGCGVGGENEAFQLGTYWPGDKLGSRLVFVILCEIFKAYLVPSKIFQGRRVG